jgi:hypothetical protein
MFGYKNELLMVRSYFKCQNKYTGRAFFSKPCSFFEDMEENSSTRDLTCFVRPHNCRATVLNRKS